VLLSAETDLELCLATYFAGLNVGGALERVLALPAAEVHLGPSARPRTSSDGALAALARDPHAPVARRGSTGRKRLGPRDLGRRGLERVDAARTRASGPTA